MKMKKNKNKTLGFHRTNRRKAVEYTDNYTEDFYDENFGEQTDMADDLDEEDMYIVDYINEDSHEPSAYETEEYESESYESEEYGIESYEAEEYESESYEA
ncbi:MAG: hypothetical protein K2N73_17715, partial [Lachnospiraceae bacterium]|nr:hypothetical protein [Lachnospiraceae bacterium]